jgi:hypothetical protein
MQMGLWEFYIESMLGKCDPYSFLLLGVSLLLLGVKLGLLLLSITS